MTWQHSPVQTHMHSRVGTHTGLQPVMQHGTVSTMWWKKRLVSHNALGRHIPDELNLLQVPTLKVPPPSMSIRLRAKPLTHGLGVGGHQSLYSGVTGLSLKSQLLQCSWPSVVGCSPNTAWQSPSSPLSSHGYLKEHYTRLGPINIHHGSGDFLLFPSNL